MANLPVLNDARILVIDDEPDLRTLYELTLLREGYRVETAGCVQEAREQLKQQRFDAIITDMRLPDGSGTDILAQLRAEQRAERCVVITAYGSAENAVESLKAGAFDYLSKPVDLKQFRAVVANALQGNVASPPVPARNTTLKTVAGNAIANAEISMAKMVGSSNVMAQVKDRIVKVARSMAPVLIRGESGTGKELVAGAIHANSHRSQGPWVPVNCSAIPENLLEAEFFGARKGAYTGASQDRIGFFQAAHGGTLFLDEIGDLPLAMQSKLLRAIQERSVRPLGALQEELVDVRIVSATHKDLAAEVQAGRFRQDLYYRLNVIDIYIPPLRERCEDLPALCQALLARIAAESGLPPPKLSAPALAQICTLPLPGNVRELENVLHRAMALSEGPVLELDTHALLTQPQPLQEGPEESSPAENPSTFFAPSPPPAAVPEPIPSDLQVHLDRIERDILVRTLRETRFNRTSAAQRLGISLRQIRYRMARLQIDAPNASDEPSDA
ncbi:sigma-54 dependent transcriptional regulator [Rhodoferax sp.]|uniref:sigma-54-dependent transcriptional regulator n=1 Tax=Rhodoferax sp. TaxID=50421 RepID=UPI002ACEAB37|nr:sigma-54 dependent transcriptional regulator [Rhodoferax sp.]MDZ7918831.1 sigma-54 dependent transcriptional regulator [Rhodoferax sp.]